MSDSRAKGEEIEEEIAEIRENLKPGDTFRVSRLEDNWPPSIQPHMKYTLGLNVGYEVVVHPPLTDRVKAAMRVSKCIVAEMIHSSQREARIDEAASAQAQAMAQALEAQAINPWKVGDQVQWGKGAYGPMTVTEISGDRIRVNGGTLTYAADTVTRCPEPEAIPVDRDGSDVVGSAILLDEPTEAELRAKGNLDGSTKANGLLIRDDNPQRPRLGEPGCVSFRYTQAMTDAFTKIKGQDPTGGGATVGHAYLRKGDRFVNDEGQTAELLPEEMAILTGIPDAQKSGLEAMAAAMAITEEPKKPEAVDGPAHYDGDKCMTIIEELGLGFRLGNALKYIWRSGRKGSRKQDLEKAIWYLRREIEKGDS